MDASALKKSITDIQRRMENLSHERDSFVAEARTLEEQIESRAEQTIAVVRSQKEQLLRDAEAARKERLSEMESFQTELDMTVAMLESVKAFSLEVAGKKTDAEAVRWVDEIRAQAQELFSMKQKQLPLVSLQLADAPVSGVNANGKAWLMGEVKVVPKKGRSKLANVPVLITTL